MSRALPTALWLGVALTLITLTGPGACWARSAPWEIEKLPSTQAPAFSLPDLSGKQISSAGFQGRVMLINFWASWCGPCREEMPDLSQLHLKFKDKGLTIIGISIDSEQSAVKQFVDMAKPLFPILLDPEMKIHDAYKVYTYPTTFLVDRKGIIRHYWLGSQEWNGKQFEKILQEHLL